MLETLTVDQLMDIIDMLSIVVAAKLAENHVDVDVCVKVVAR